LRIYADSSLIVALYVQQQSSPKAIALMQRYGQPLPFTPWHRLEVRNAIRLAVCQNVIDSPQAKTQLKQIDADLREEALLVHQPIDWTDVLRKAEQLGANHNETIGCRSADLFHTATALHLGCEQFLTFDLKQTILAQAVGLAVRP
jgi:predicted nucleic acid-binding protein